MGNPAPDGGQEVPRRSANRFCQLLDIIVVGLEIEGFVFAPGNRMAYQQGGKTCGLQLRLQTRT